jgi:hypothetical protein
MAHQIPLIRISTLIHIGSGQTFFRNYHNFPFELLNADLLFFRKVGHQRYTIKWDISGAQHPSVDTFCAPRSRASHFTHKAQHTHDKWTAVSPTAT